MNIHANIDKLKKLFFRKTILGITLLGLIFLLSQCTTNSSNKINFNTQIKPILNKHCIHCHGGVKQNGGLSMMTREKILAPTTSGQPAIIPGNPSASEFISRLTAEDVEERMPFEAHPLAQKEINVLTQWVKEGAEWGLHWAYNPVEAVAIPKIEKALGAVDGQMTTDWAKNDIDYFIGKKLAENHLSPSPLAEKSAILRRVSLDLIGLPAPKELATAFLSTQNSISYQQLVDNLLSSPHYGERWASMWLDLARYADTKGFERDPHRSIYPYRDYVIKAFNEDLPYDQFITEQLAGDLLPNPTDNQLIATGFHRNTTTNDEGGTDNEEYRVAAVVNRVNTTGEAILGTTFACVQCHGHPYDPFEHQEYYQLMAFFNNTRDEDTNADYPLLRMYRPADSLKLAELTNWVKTVESEERADEIAHFLKTWQPTIYSMDTDSLVNAALYDTKFLGFRQNGQAIIRNVTLTGKSKLIIKQLTSKKGGHFSIHLDSFTGDKLIDYALSFNVKDNPFLEIPLVATTGKHDLYLKYDNPLLESPNAMGFRMDWFYFTNDFPGQTTAEYDTQKQHFWDLMEARPPTTLIMQDNPAERSRTTKVFDRGNWQMHKETVQAATPKVLNAYPTNAPKNRLGLAQWITDKKNPLTARTMVNRLWEQLFGKGLVETVEDLGTQGNVPTHPELLDWLAYQYMYEFDWSTKRLLKAIVTSATYRQSTKASPMLLEKDPYNQLLARGPRIRLSAEQIRDQALAISGLLNPKMYGEPVMPHQPDGVWSSPYNNAKWVVSEGAEKYRRSIYTYMKRSSPFTAMETFDVATRDVCSARRIRTNTPLQALVTLNDEGFMEMAKHLAVRMQTEGGQKVSEQIQAGYQLALGKPIAKKKLAILEGLYRETLQDFEKQPTDAKAITEGLGMKEDLASMAAMIVVANTIMNLDEFMMK